MSWPCIPLEIFQIILELLDLESVKNLRLVDRTFNLSCLGPRFSIRQPTIDLTEQSFESLDVLINNPILRQKVHHWPEVWTKATKVHAIVISALADTKVSVSSLDIYRDIIRCSVFLTDHTLQLADLDQAGRDAVGSNLHTLKMSICTEISKYTWNIDMGLESRAQISDMSFGSVAQLPQRCSAKRASREFLGVVQLLKSTPNLRCLDLHFYFMATNHDSYHWIMTAISGEVFLPKLEVLALAGFSITQDALLSFLSQHEKTIKSITLETITITTGTWQPIFDHLSTNMPCLDNVHFSNLTQESSVQGSRKKNVERINLQAIWEDGFPVPTSISYPVDGGDYYPCGGSSYMLHRRSFGRDQLRKGLRFKPRRGRAVSSGRVMNWIDHIRNTCGPPTFSLMCPPRRPSFSASDDYS